MKPILYSENETDYTSNGLGVLSDCASCEVESEANGIYELTMEYPVNGIHADQIAAGRSVVVKPDDYSDPQIFDIYEVDSGTDSMIIAYAHHVSYRMSKIPVSPFSAGNVAIALERLRNNAVEDCPFTFWTDKTTEADFSVDYPVSMRSRIAGTEGSLLDVYGGEYEFDNFSVKLYGSRGQDNGVTLRYGKNIVDLQQEKNIQDTITGIYPYWRNSDGDYTELPEKVVYSDNSQNFPRKMTIPVDFSSEFEGKPTEDQLRESAVSYIESHDIGVPKVSISVEFTPLYQTDEFFGVSGLDKVRLFDTVHVEFEKLGILASAKIVKTVYNVITERYSSIDVGNVRANISDTIAEQQTTIDEKLNDSFLNGIVLAATGWLLGAASSNIVPIKSADGKGWAELLFIDTDSVTTAKDVLRVNNRGIGMSHNGVNGPYTDAWTLKTGFVADAITSGTINANLVKIINLIVNHVLSESDDGKYTLEAWAAAIMFFAGDKSRIRLDVDDVEDYDGGVFNSGNIQAFSGNVDKSGNLLDSTSRKTSMHGYYIEVGQKKDGTHDGYIRADRALIRTIQADHDKAGIYEASKPRWMRIGINGRDYIIFGEPYGG